jgi:tripartite-type tricarboxylate transporter receptor subunit TctC
MKMSRRLAISLAIAASAAAMATSGALAQAAYPSDRINVTVGFSPGGFVDTFARIVGQKLQDKWGQTVTIENKGGAGGNTAAAQVAAAKPDGHNLLVTSTAIAINPTLYKNPGFKPDSLVPVAIAVSSPETIATHPSKPGNLKDYLAWAKDQEITFASAGVGSGSHLATEYFLKNIAKTPYTHVPFRGGALSVQAALGNQVDLVASSFGIIPQVVEGKLTGLAVASEERVAAMPNVATYPESGFPFIDESWVGIFAPADTPPDVVAKLNAAVNEILADKETREKLTGMGYIVHTRDEPQVKAYLEEERKKWGEMVHAVGAKVE